MFSPMRRPAGWGLLVAGVGREASGPVFALDQAAEGRVVGNLGLSKLLRWSDQTKALEFSSVFA